MQYGVLLLLVAVGEEAHNRIGWRYQEASEHLHKLTLGDLFYNALSPGAVDLNHLYYKCTLFPCQVNTSALIWTRPRGHLFFRSFQFIPISFKVIFPDYLMSLKEM